MMVEGRTGADIARSLDKTEKTICVWKKQPAFQARLQELRASVTEQAVELLRTNLVQNIGNIQSIADHGGEPGVVSSQLKAAIWAAEQILKAGQIASDREASTMAAQVDNLTSEEQQHLLARGF